jgi:large subunit ribosomal protein L22
MEFKSTQKFLRMSPRKLRLVADVARKMTPTEAVEKLVFTQKRAALPLIKVIKTAIANAKQQGISESDLIFKEIQVTQGPRLKRFRAGARGVAKPYVKAMSHIRVILKTKKEEKKSGTKS